MLPLNYSSSCFRIFVLTKDVEKVLEAYYRTSVKKMDYGERNITYGLWLKSFEKLQVYGKFVYASDQADS